jgi:hypothetical protein
MIRILISDAAYAALCTGVPEDRRLPAERCPQGGYFLWLAKRTANRLSAARGKSEGYSDVILRLAEMERA